MIDSVAGRSLLQFWNESRNMQGKGTDFQGRDQREREDKTKGKSHSDVVGSITLSSSPETEFFLSQTLSSGRALTSSFAHGTIGHVKNL